jgi:hypothetical protein
MWHAKYNQKLPMRSSSVCLCMRVCVCLSGQLYIFTESKILTVILGCAVKKYNQNLSTELRCGVHVCVRVCVYVYVCLWKTCHQKMKREFRKLRYFGILRAVDR